VSESSDNLPKWARPGLDRYLRQGIEPGSGLRAILENNLQQAMARCCPYAGGAGANDASDVWWIVFYLYNEAPGPSWGSPEKVKAWLARDWSTQRGVAEAGDCT
jgi:hypothetical protein